MYLWVVLFMLLLKMCCDNNNTRSSSGECSRYKEYKKVQTALKEQQEANAQLRGYMDGILTNIIVKYPELLEVKN